MNMAAESRNDFNEEIRMRSRRREYGDNVLNNLKNLLICGDRRGLQRRETLTDNGLRAMG